MDPVRNPYAPGAGRRSLIDRHSDHIGRGGGVVGVARVDSGDVVGPAFHPLPPLTDARPLPLTGTTVQPKRLALLAPGGEGFDGYIFIYIDLAEKDRSARQNRSICVILKELCWSGRSDSN